MNYSENPEDVRVDLWKPSGKWKDTIMLKWTDYGDGEEKLIHNIFVKLMKEQYPNRYVGLRATCLKPYHKDSHPISILVEE